MCSNSSISREKRVSIKFVSVASPTPSVEELTPCNKRLKVGDKQKEKIDSRTSSVWDDVGVSMA